MEVAIEKEQEYIILSKEVTNATKCKVTEIFDEDKFAVELQSDENYTDTEKVDMFAVAGSGVVYFETELQSVNGRILTIKNPSKMSVIQRREYTRVEINKNILIDNLPKKIRATIIDISAGGMCIISDTEMDTKTLYPVDINLEKNLLVSCKFKPIRVNLSQDNKYKISGQFKLITNVDRVALTQYCLKKVTETEHK